MEILSYIFLGNTVLDWLIACSIIAGAYILFRILQALLYRKLSVAASQSKNNVDDMLVKVIDQTKELFIIFTGVFIASKILIVPSNWKMIINKIFIVIAALQIGLWLGGLINHLTFNREKQNGENKEQTAMHAFGLFGKILIWTVVSLVTVQNVTGIKMDALITSLGIGGIAIGLAIQNVLKDIFASLSIFLDKPFLVGDYIVIGDTGGTVENIGLKSTRIKTLLGEEVIFSNSNLLENRIHNYRKMERRMVLINISISPETSYEALRELPKLFEEIVKSQKDTTFGRANLSEIADYTLNYEIVYHVESPDYALFTKIKEEIFLTIIKRLQEKGISMPYPTQTIRLNK